MVAIAATALLTAGGLILAASRRRGGLELAWAADLWGIVLIAVLCAATGGASSPFGLLYLFAIGHAAAFQPRGRFVFACVVSLLAFLAPVVYSHVSAVFAAVAVVGVASVLLAAEVIHLALARVRDQRRRMEFLIDASAKLDASLDPEETLRKIAEASVPELAELCVIDLPDGRGSIGTTVAAAADPAVARGVERLRETAPLDMAGTHPVVQVLRTGAPSVIDDLTDRTALREAAQSDEHERFMREVGYRSAAVFPMVARGRTHGAISFLHVRADARYGPTELAVLEDFTARAAMAFDNARLYAERAHVAQTLQRSLVPTALSVIPGLELASCFRPMGAGNEVGGDFYDAFGAEEGHWLVVGDVCGKGADAAALTGFLRHTIAAYARSSTSPAHVLSEVNRAMLDQDFDSRFATVILARVAPPNPYVVVTIAAAGHPAAVIARSGGEVAEFGEFGELLGVFPDPAIREASTVLAPGDALALYTDGLLDAHAPDHTLTVREVIGQLKRSSPRSAQETVHALLGLIDGHEDVRDDIAILSARVKPAEVDPALSADANPSLGRGGQEAPSP